MQLHFHHTCCPLSRMVCMQAMPFSLHWIAAFDHVDAANMLLSHNVEIDTVAESVVSMVLPADLERDTHSQCCLLVCMQGMTPLMYACVCGNTNMVGCLLSYGANASFTNEMVGKAVLHGDIIKGLNGCCYKRNYCLRKVKAIGVLKY